MYNTWINPLQPYQCISRTLTLQLFKPSFQDIRILHLINKRCRGQTGLSVPVVPVHGHFSKKKIGSSQMSNEWEFSCIAQMMQPFPLKYTHRLFPPIKDWRKKKKIFILRFQIPPVGKRLQLFFIYVSPCPVKAQQWARGAGDVFFQRTIWDETEKGKKKRSPVSPPTVKNFTTCEAPEQSESFGLCSVGGSSRKNPA